MAMSTIPISKACNSTYGLLRDDAALSFKYQTTQHWSFTVIARENMVKTHSEGLGYRTNLGRFSHGGCWLDFFTTWDVLAIIPRLHLSFHWISDPWLPRSSHTHRPPRLARPLNKVSCRLNPKQLATPIYWNRNLRIVTYRRRVWNSCGFPFFAESRPPSVWNVQFSRLRTNNSKLIYWDLRTNMLSQPIPQTTKPPV